jgi:hypothetical protein
MQHAVNVKERGDLMKSIWGSVGNELIYANFRLPALCICKRSNPIVCLGAFILCFLYAIPGTAQLVTTLTGSEETTVSRFIANGTNPLLIRASMIRDPKLVSAILQGARARQISVLVDYVSPELNALAGQKNVRVHVSPVNKRGTFGTGKMRYSFVMEVGNGYYQILSGPLIWTKQAFGQSASLVAGSGDGPGESFHNINRIFKRDFSQSSAIKSATLTKHTTNR